ncbi:MT-A70-domain-containing protein [Chytridium lagenaria]|nr:MT-A70-domain-containing protein [Chytridium lagenaria]
MSVPSEVLLSFSNGWVLSHERPEEQGLEFKVPLQSRPEMSNETSTVTFASSTSGKITKRKAKKKKPPQKPKDEFHEWAKAFLLLALDEPLKSSDVFPLHVKNACDAITDGLDWVKDTDLRKSYSTLFSHLHYNKTSNRKIITAMGCSLIFPSYSGFLMSDLNEIASIQQAGKFDLVLMDPPWENLSASRSNAYKSLDAYELFKIPMQNVCHDHALVAVWVTNNPKYLRFVKEKLFPAWGLKHVGTWLWVKIRNDGSLTMQLDSLHRKPYEPLLLGRCARGDPGSAPAECPTNRIIMSMPSAYHSQKPIIDSLLQNYIKPDAKKLELFARQVRPGWISWGNEVLKFNDLRYYKESQ